MNQITVRGIPPEVERAIRSESGESGLSLNKTIIKMLKRAVAAREKKGSKQKTAGNDISRYLGTWTNEEAAEFDRVVEEAFEQIDEGSWS